MNRENRINLKKYRGRIYIRESQRRWNISIRPDNVRIDNYEMEAHFHPKLKRMHIPIKYENMEEVGLIIELHLERNNGINKEELKEELLCLK